ncbi:FAD:protein FMN transferase [Maribellus sediminis]|uniref:FAD:protein FMN transferase n=1 Tax=Maribellus sediminis TaxID=2696285 RepID=UPI00142F8E1F|nr:FAD:protein FMN transferase [Maribellus sediminis]
MSGLQIFSDSFIAFGAQCDVVFPGTDADLAKELLQDIKKNVSQIELAISRSEEVAEIWQVNRAGKGEWVEVTDDLLELLHFSKNFYEMSNGALDVTIAPLMRLWEDGKEPSEKEIEEAKSRCGLDHVDIDEEQKRLMFLADGMELDFGVLEKAYILDILKQELTQIEGLSGIISFEEEVVLALGRHPGGDEWPVGIRNLEQPDEFNHVFELSNQSMVTAGTAFLNFETGELKERLIISPESGYPVEGRKTVSVKANSALMAAFIAHIWLILPENDKAIIADQLENIEIFETEYISNDVKTKHTIIEGGNDDDE